MTPALPLLSAALLLPIFALGAVPPFPRAALCLLSCGALGLLAARPEGLRGRPAWPVLALPLVSLLSLVFSPFKHSAVPGFLTDISVAAFLLALHQGGDACRAAVRRLLPAAFFLTLAVHAWDLSLTGAWVHTDAAGRSRFWNLAMDGALARPWYNANVLAGVLLLLAPVVMDSLPPAGAAAAMGCAGLVLAQTGSAPGLLLFIGEIVFLLALRRRPSWRWPRWAPVAAGAAGLGLFFAAVFTDGDRRAWWSAGLAMFKSRPFLGVGPGAFGEAWPGFAGSWSGWNTFYAHQFFIETLAEKGILGAAVFLGLLKASFKGAWSQPMNSFRGALWAGAAAFLIFNGIHVGFSVPGAALLFWAQMALLRPAPEGPAWTPAARAAVGAVILLSVVIALRAAWGDLCLERAREASSPAAMAGTVEEGIRWAPWEPEFYSLRGRARFAEGRREEGRADLLRAVQRAPTSARFHAELGEACDALNDRAAARAAFHRATELLPLQPLYWMRLSELSDEKEAAAAARRVLWLLERKTLVGGDDVSTPLQNNPRLKAGLLAAARARLTALGEAP